MFVFINTNFFLLKYISILILISNYIFLSMFSFIIFQKLKIINLNNSSSNNKEHFFIILFNLIFFLNLAGVPPLPGFFIKINFLFNILNYINIYLLFIILIINFTIYYFYIQFYKFIWNYSKIKNININSKIILPTIIILCLFINFYPIYNLFLLWLI